jgi:hypothetical protein
VRDFHDPNACPASPVTATMLRIVLSALDLDKEKYGVMIYSTIGCSALYNGVIPRKPQSTTRGVFVSLIVQYVLSSAPLHFANNEGSLHLKVTVAV